MSEEEKRRTLYKRQPTITKTYTPPYTSIRQKESEKLKTEVPTVKAPVLGEEELTSSKKAISEQYAGMAISNLDELSSQILSVENQAVLELKAKEAAQRD